jgi:hypothetical protein
MVFALAVVLFAAASQAQMMNSVAGSITASYTSQDSLVVAPMHILSMSSSSGTNTSTGTMSFMDGAAATNLSLADLAMGSGPHQGYLKMEKDGNAVLVKWSGSVVTKMMEGKPTATTFEGDFSYVSGSGQFEGIMGEGNYKGSFTSPTSYTVEWEGSYHMMTMKINK